MSSKKKRIIFCTYSSVYSALVLEKLLQCDEIDVIAVINSTRVLKPGYSHLWGAIQQIKITGLRYASYLFLVTDFFSYLARIKKLSLPAIYQLARDHNIPVHETRDINNSLSTSFVAEYLPDYILAAHFNQLIKSDLLSLSKTSFINIHPSLLPAYKGVDPVFFAMLANEKEIGVTLHNMSESFDTGEIISQKVQPLSTGNTLFDNNCQLFEKGAQLAINWITQKDTTKSHPMISNTKSGYDSWPTAATVRLFKHSGKKLIRFKNLWKCVNHYEA